VKASWAQSEHEREQYYNQCVDYAERVAELEERLVLASQLEAEAKQRQDARGRSGRPASITTTKTSSTN
jgi:hypothetical protein